MEKKTRNVEYDLIRTVAMTFVIAAHTPMEFGNVYLYSLIPAITMVNNGLFFMLSGVLNLNKVFATINDYILYYKKRFISILVPFSVVSLLLFLYGRGYFAGTNEGGRNYL